jgi:hypothetical protein
MKSTNRVSRNGAKKNAASQGEIPSKSLKPIERKLLKEAKSWTPEKCVLVGKRFGILSKKLLAIADSIATPATESSDRIFLKPLDAGFDSELEPELRVEVEKLNHEERLDLLKILREQVAQLERNVIQIELSKMQHQPDTFQN